MVFDYLLKIVLIRDFVNTGGGGGGGGDGYNRDESGGDHGGVGRGVLRIIQAKILELDSTDLAPSACF
ncbi:hypothetical protein C5167_003800 [Papaver somniferum]|uniref:Uncharacterized protein n=1 Tax=Papaver somniferum TaxID=3469 RepID=A0A4Y7L1Z7_PAPSO|nr:hypothetical protein C5167_003800 [Papaver somniferum]